VAARNTTKHNVGSRVRLYQSDLFQALAGKRYDLIVTNPPYVAADAMHLLPGEYRAEPEVGLVSGRDGLDACLQIMLQSPGHLNESACLICEVGESERRLAELLPSVPFVWLEFSKGGSGVFVLSRQELEQASAVIARAIEDRKNVA
jgi:ribosomal protein L3 glutamine methyltransferase